MTFLPFLTLFQKTPLKSPLAHFKEDTAIKWLLNWKSWHTLAEYKTMLREYIE